MKISLQLIVLLQCHFWLEILMALFSASHLCFSCYFCSTIQLTWEPNLECLLWEFYWGSQCWHSFWPCDAKVGISITHRWMDRSQHCLTPPYGRKLEYCIGFSGFFSNSTAFIHFSAATEQWSFPWQGLTLICLAYIYLYIEHVVRSLLVVAVWCGLSSNRQHLSYVGCLEGILSELLRAVLCKH